MKNSYIQLSYRCYTEQVLVAHAAEVSSPNASAKVNFFKTSRGNGTRSCSV